MNDDQIKQLAQIILTERRQKEIDGKNEKLKQVLLLLAGGSALMTAIFVPGTARLFKDFIKDDSEWKEWKMFNVNYLRRTLRKLESQKLIEVSEERGIGKIILTKNGQRKLLEMSVEDMFIRKPTKWDGKWRMIFYDVTKEKNTVRDKFRAYLKAGGFYRWQKSVYLHAYPCEKEVDFLRNFLGISGDVRLVIADQIENDQIFRDYFGV